MSDFLFRPYAILHDKNPLCVSRHPLFGHQVRLSSGSGVIVSHAGVIVTNAHVVTTAGIASARPQLRVQLHNGDTYEATVRDVDRKADIATVKVNPKVRRRIVAGHMLIYTKITVTLSLPSLSKVKLCWRIFHTNSYPDTWVPKTLTASCQT